MTDKSDPNAKFVMNDTTSAYSEAIVFKSALIIYLKKNWQQVKHLRWDIFFEPMKYCEENTIFFTKIHGTIRDDEETKKILKVLTESWAVHHSSMRCYTFISYESKKG